MAKYRLTKNPNKSVNCEVLNENLNGYIVRFENGMIKNVKKSSVYALDKIDKAVINEGVIDDVKSGLSKFGKKVAHITKKVYDKVKELFVKVFNIDDYVFFTTVDGRLINASHPINAMQAAKEQDCINYIPSHTTIEMCNELGIEPEAVEGYMFEGEYNGGFYLPEISTTNESILSIIKEARAYNHPNDSVILEGGDIIDMPVRHIIRRLTSGYAGLYNKTLDKKATTILPIIFGAPGIGKSAIIEGIKEEISKLGFKDEIGRPQDITIITVNANNVNGETFTMPANVAKKAWSEIIRSSEDINHTDKDTGFKGGMLGGARVIKDLPKSWLPMYDYKDVNDNDRYEYADGEFVTSLEYENAVANGGGIVKDPETGLLKLVNGPGGIFFIDEYTRMSQAGKDSLMTIAASRTIGQSLRFGDRWFICGAANRFSDMSEKATREGFEAELADRTRFQLMNYVPEPDVWFKWANKINDAGKPNVIPEIVRFVKDSVDSNHWGYFYDAHNFGEDDNPLNTKYASCTPRTWEALSNIIVSDVLYGSSSSNLMSHLQTIDPVDRTEDLDYILRVAVGCVGEEAGNAFVADIKSKISELTPEIAKALWVNGVNTKNEEAQGYIKDTVKVVSPMDLLITYNDELFPILIDNLKIGFTEQGAMNLLDIALLNIESYKGAGAGGRTQQVKQGELQSVWSAIGLAYNINLDSNNQGVANLTKYYLTLKNSIK